MIIIIMVMILMIMIAINDESYEIGMCMFSVSDSTTIFAQSKCITIQSYLLSYTSKNVIRNYLKLIQLYDLRGGYYYYGISSS